VGSQCDHSHIAHNGTTYSGRLKRYIVHCTTPPNLHEDYLTPTQRANATIRQLSSLLNDTQNRLAEKEKEINQLTKEMVELRILKAEGASEDAKPEEEGREEKVMVNGSDKVDTSTPEPWLRVTSTPCGRSSTELCGISLADSGHFEDPSPHSSPSTRTFIPEKDIEKIKVQHLEELRALKESSNSKVESLLEKLAEANEKYFELRPQVDELQKKIEALEKEKVDLRNQFEEKEERHKTMYLQMFNKGQEAAYFQESEENTKPQGNLKLPQTIDNNKDGPPQVVSVPNLVKELEVTRQELESVKTMYRRLLESKKTKSEQEAEVTLQFLKSAVYYFLTDRENTAGHLAAIQSILGFTPEEKAAIERGTYRY